VTCYFFPGWGWYLTDLNWTAVWSSGERRQIFFRFVVRNLILSIPNSKLIFKNFLSTPKTFSKFWTTLNYFLVKKKNCVEWKMRNNLFDSTQKIILCLQLNKKNFIKKFLSWWKKNFIKKFLSRRKKNKNIFFHCEKIIFTIFFRKIWKIVFFWKTRKIIKFDDFRPPPKIWQIDITTPQISMFGGVWTHICGLDLEF